MSGYQSSTHGTYTSTNRTLHSYSEPLKATSLVSPQKERLSSCLFKVHGIK